MIAKIALMLGAIWDVTMMVVSSITLCIAVGANQTKTSNSSNLRNKNGEKEMENVGRDGKTFLVHTAIKEDGYSVTFKAEEEEEKGTVMVSHIFITNDGAITHYDMKGNSQ